MQLISILGTTEVLTTIGIAVLVYIYEIIVDKYIQEDKHKTYARRFGRAVFLGGLVVLFHLTLHNVQKLETIKKELVGVNEKATAFDFFKPYETIQKLDDNSTLQKLLKSQLENTRERLRQIEKGELNLSREEVVPVWENLISKYSSGEIYATNVVSINDWEKFSPNQGLEAHEDFFSKPKTVLKRLFIYDSNDSLSVKGAKELAKKQLELSKRLHLNKRFEIKAINKNKIDNTAYGSTMYSTFGTLDIVIFDKNCLLQTNTKKRNNVEEIISGIITNNKLKILVANEMFQKLWSIAEEIDNFIKQQ